MSPRFKTNLLEHTKAVAAWARRCGAQASIDALTLMLTLQRDQRRLLLRPQFVGRRDGRNLVYFDQPDEHAVGFVGWLPYAPLAWDISLSKQVFKDAARALGLRTPASWQDAAAVDAPCLVKRDRSSFGVGMAGPFSATQAQARGLDDGEYFEAFCVGRIARAWYWSGRLAALEVFDMPRVEGDGVRSVGRLLADHGVEDLDPHAALLGLQGLALGDVLAPGLAAVGDYRYVSPLNPTLYANHNLLRTSTPPPGLDRFVEAGQRLWPRIPAPGSGDAARAAGFVLDAIVDADDEPWFLEINSNAQGHPDLYAPMLDDCLPALASERPAPEPGSA